MLYFGWIFQKMAHAPEIWQQRLTYQQIDVWLNKLLENPFRESLLVFLLWLSHALKSFSFDLYHHQIFACLHHRFGLDWGMTRILDISKMHGPKKPKWPYAFSYLLSLTISWSFSNVVCSCGNLLHPSRSKNVHFTNRWIIDWISANWDCFSQTDWRLWIVESTRPAAPSG